MFHAFIIDDDVISVEATYKMFPWEELNITKIDKIYIPDGASARILKEKPDLVLIDIEMGNISGIDIIKECKEHKSESLFVIISGHNNFEYAHAAVNLGAVYYMLKPINPDDIVDLASKLKLVLNQQHFSSYLSNNKSFENYLLPVLDNNNYRFLISSLTDKQLKEFCTIFRDNTFYRYKIGTNKFLFIIESSFVSESVLFDLKRFVSDNKVVISISKCFNKNEDNIYEHFKQTNQLSYQYFLDPSCGFLIDASINADTKILKEAYKELSSSISSKNFEKIGKILKNLTPLFNFQHYTMAHVMWFYNTLVGKINLTYNPDVTFPFSQMDEEELTINFKSLNNLCEELYLALKELLSPEDSQDVYRSKLWKEISSYIEENYAKKIQVSDICSHFYISTKTLYNISVANTNKSYLEYLTFFRIEKAKILLKTSSLSVPEIAEKIGIKDHYYFNRMFKKHTGFTPIEFKNKEGNFDNVE